MSLCPTYKHHGQEGGGFKPSGDVLGPGRLKMKRHPGGDWNPGPRNPVIFSNDDWGVQSPKRNA